MRILCTVIVSLTLVGFGLTGSGLAVRGATVGSKYILVRSMPQGKCLRDRVTCRQSVARLRVLVGPPHLPASATRVAVLTGCPGNPPGAVCGTVNVPLDRKHPKGAQIPIFFELFTHTNPGPALSAILVNWGGPGEGTTDPGDAANALQLFGNNLDAHDLLLIDDRGRGYSATIDCVPLQHGTEPFAKGIADCAAQLGSAASRYAAGDIAKDTDAVRKALGYDKVDYYVASAGGSDVSAYATRFGSHLRSLVLDAPAGVPSLNMLGAASTIARKEPQMIALACAYSPTCRGDHPNPFAELDWLIRYIRMNPLEGPAYDASGNLLHVRVDESNLLAYIIHNPTGNFVSTGELLAAAASLRRGDRAPLLRLEAESYYSIQGDSGDPTVFSVGAEAAACPDLYVPWQWSVPTYQRVQQYAGAVARLPEDYFAPFSAAAAAGPAFNIAVYCAWWEVPTPPSPVILPGAVYPRVPALLLSGDMDDVVPSSEVVKVAALFPESTFVSVAGSGHVTVSWSTCAVTLASQFVETTRVGNTACTQTPQTVFPAVGRFPLFAREATPAMVDPTNGNQVGVRERKAVTVSVAAAIDALQRTTIGSGSDHCLRAGTFTTVYGSNGQTTMLRDCSFSSDVAVTGFVTWRADNTLVADLRLHGEGTASGAIHVIGSWLAPGRVGCFKVTGELGGLKVALLVPEA